MTETVANGYSYDSSQRELSNEYQDDRVKKIFMIFCFFVHRTKVNSASEGLSSLIITSRIGSVTIEDLE